MAAEAGQREPLLDDRIPHPYREIYGELKGIRELLRDIRDKQAPRIPGVSPAVSAIDVNVFVAALRKHGSLMMADDVYVETVDLTTARSPAKEFEKLAGIALTIFSNTGSFDLYINQKDAPHKITISALTFPQTILIDWCNIKTVFIGNTAQTGLTAILIAWLPSAPLLPLPPAAAAAMLVITRGDREEFRKMGDVNRDGVIDDADVKLMAAAFGSRRGDAKWNPDADLNGDGIVDLKDHYKTSQNYGLTIEAWKARK